MPRRIHLPHLTTGDTDLPDSQARHVRDVLRMGPGDVLEAFDDSGSIASATILAATTARVTVRIKHVTQSESLGFTWTIASAIPKGPRADWMIEKLSELGTTTFIPLIAARSVSLPTGKEKLDRWSRLAAEAAKQSGRRGVMRIEPLTPLSDLIAALGPTSTAHAAAPVNTAQTAWYFSTKPDATPVTELTRLSPPKSLLMLIGPEGGWTDDELALVHSASATAVKLTSTILRIETAALSAAVIAAVWPEPKTGG